jgi:PucR family transcriptional regulator, purine catabolism regulatory protein
VSALAASSTIAAMATLEGLRLAILPGAHWLANGPEESGSPARDRDLGWVRLMRARVPAFDALDPGDLAIVPLAAVPVVIPDDDALGAFVDAAGQAGIAGIVVVGDEGGADGPTRDRLVAAARSAGLPVLDAGAGDAAAIERSAIGFLVNDRAELERQATILERRLEQVALAEGGPEALAAAIAGFLGRAVAIEGRRGVVAVHAPVDVPGAAAAVAAYHDRPRTAATRIPLPMPLGAADTASPGALALLGERPASELERIATARVAGLLALELSRADAVGRAIESARREVLPAGGPPWVVIVARQAEPEERFDAARREAVRRDVRALAPARRMTLRGDAQSVELRTVAAVADDDPAGVGLAARIARLLGRTAAVSRPFRDASSRSAAEAEARVTLEAAEHLVPPPIAARADRLAAYRLLGSLHNLPDGERHARELLARLLEGRPDVRRERLATLRTLLDHPGVAETASALGVHRNTIAYRIRRIEAVTGWRLADPELRVALSVAVRLVHDDQV